MTVTPDKMPRQYNQYTGVTAGVNRMSLGSVLHGWNTFSVANQVGADVVPQKKKSEVRVVPERQTKIDPPRTHMGGSQPNHPPVGLVLHFNEYRLPSYLSEADGIVFPGPNLPDY